MPAACAIVEEALRAGVLLDEVVAGLERGEDAALNGPLRRVVVAAEAGEARLARLAGANERVDGVSAFQDVNVARVKLDYVHMVGLKTFEAAVDGVLDRLPRPALARERPQRHAPPSSPARTRSGRCETTSPIRASVSA